MSAPERQQVRKPLLIVLGVVVVAALVVLVVLPLLGGSDDAALAPLPVAPGTPTESATAHAAPEADAHDATAAADTAAPRDPFEPLVAPSEEPTAAPAPEAAPTPAPGDTAVPTAAIAPETTEAGSAPAPAPAPPSAPPPGASEEQAAAPPAGPKTVVAERPGSDARIDGVEVTLVDVFAGADGKPRVLVAVDGVGYEAGVGGSIAERFPVTAIDGPCARLRGSAGDTTLCRAE